MITNVYCGVMLNLNLVKKHPERILKKIENLLVDLIMKTLIFLFQKKVIAGWK